MFPETAFGPFLLLPVLAMCSLVGLSGVIAHYCKRREEQEKMVAFIALAGGVFVVILGVLLLPLRIAGGVFDWAGSGRYRNSTLRIHFLSETFSPCPTSCCLLHGCE